MADVQRRIGLGEEVATDEGIAQEEGPNIGGNETGNDHREVSNGDEDTGKVIIWGEDNGGEPYEPTYYGPENQQPTQWVHEQDDIRDDEDSDDRQPTYSSPEQSSSVPTPEKNYWECCHCMVYNMRMSMLSCPSCGELRCSECEKYPDVRDGGDVASSESEESSLEEHVPDEGDEREEQPHVTASRKRRPDEGEPDEGDLDEGGAKRTKVE